MISETNKRCNRYLRSQGAIAFEKYRHLKKNSYMIHPFSDARKYIECFMCLIFLIQFVMVPLDIAYFGKPPSSTDLYTSAPWKTVRLLTDCFCFTDVWLNYLTGYFNEHKKQSEMSPKKVALKYFSSKFFIDLISSIPTNIDLLINISNEQTISTLQIFSCLKLLRFNTFLKYSRNIEEICHLEDGAHFGEIALVMRDELRVASVVAVDVCELYRLDRKEFDRAIHPYPDLLDNIQRIAADRMERTNMLDEFDRREMASKRLY
ncbi:hypothetical protein FQR65_LT11636 [Abscondita terminalis]|nr:hypothetical protein FQR65_LT11636 [Abscondita terminalis]